MALRFGPAEYFALTVVAFAAVAVLLGGSIVRGLFSLFLGLALGLVGIDQLTGNARFSFGIPQLLDGIDEVLERAGVVVDRRSVEGDRLRREVAIDLGQATERDPGRRGHLGGRGRLPEPQLEHQRVHLMAVVAGPAVDLDEARPAVEGACGGVVLGHLEEDALRAIDP